VDNGDVIQSVYTGFSGVWRYSRLLPGEGDRYVATSGSDDLNICLDQGAPCATIGYAVQVANPDESIFVAEGTYTENLDVGKPLALMGGYEATGWTRDITAYETIIDGSDSQTIIGDWDGDMLRFPSVISEGDGYKMWYDAYGPEGFAVGLAHSTDGLNWDKDPANPVLRSGDGGEWTTEHIGQISVLADQGLYKMWFSGSDGGRWETGYATSSDGIDWLIYGDGPVSSVGAPGR